MSLEKAAFRQSAEKRLHVFTGAFRRYLETLDDVVDDLIEGARSVHERERHRRDVVENQRTLGNQQHRRSIGVAAQLHPFAEARRRLAVHLKTPHASAVASSIDQRTSHLNCRASTQRSSSSGVVASAVTHANAV